MALFATIQYHLSSSSFAPTYVGVGDEKRGDKVKE